MGRQKETGFENTRKNLYTAMKSLGRLSATDLAFFKNLHAFNQTGVSPLDFIEQNLPAIDARDKRYSDLLKRRFWKNETIRMVASSFHLSTDQINRLQRDALNALTGIILEKEEAIKEIEAQALIEKIPAPNYSRLFGIEKIHDKLAGLLASPSEPWLIVVGGIGGIGKTALVDSVIRAGIPNLHYRDVVWIRITQGGDLPIWERLNLILAMRLLQDATTSQTKALRKLLRKVPHLIVIDGLETEFDEELLTQLKRIVNPTRILLTCRNLPSTSLDTHLMRVSEIDFESALHLLNYQAEIIGLDEEVQPFAKPIYQVAGGNPLALKVAVGLLKTWSVDAALRAIREGKGSRLKGLFDTVFLAAWNSLSQTTREIFGAMVFAGNEGATLDQLGTITQHPEAEVREAISDLVLRSLVEVQGSVHERRYGIHNLTETFLRSRLADTSLDNGVKALSNINYWQEKVETGDSSAVLESNGNNIYRAVELGFDFGQLEPSLKLLFRLHAGILSMRISSSWVGLFVKAMPATENNAKQKTKLLNQTGSIYWQLHQFDRALENFQMAKDLAQRENFPDQIISAQLGIALSYWTQGLYKRANREAKAARKLARAGSEARVQGRLAMVSGVIAQAEGKYLAADKHFLKAARHYRRDLFVLAQIAVNRGLCFQNNRHIRQALKHYRKAEDILRGLKTKGKEIAQIELLRSSAYHRIGDLTNSSAALKRVAALISEQTDLSAQAFFETSLGRVYLGLGRNKEAKRTLRGAARLWKKVGNPRIEVNVTEFFEAETET